MAGGKGGGGTGKGHKQATPGQIAELRKLLSGLEATNPNVVRYRGFTDDRVLHRFITARNGNVPVALKMLLEHLVRNVSLSRLCRAFEPVLLCSATPPNPAPELSLPLSPLATSIHPTALLTAGAPFLHDLALFFFCDFFFFALCTPLPMIGALFPNDAAQHCFAAQPTTPFLTIRRTFSEQTTDRTGEYRTRWTPSWARTCRAPASATSSIGAVSTATAGLASYSGHASTGSRTRTGADRRLRTRSVCLSVRSIGLSVWSVDLSVW